MQQETLENSRKPKNVATNGAEQSRPWWKDVPTPETKTDVELIGGIPHKVLHDKKYPGPLEMLGGAMAGTIGHIATAGFSNRADEARQRARAELDSTAELQANAPALPKANPDTIMVSGAKKAKDMSPAEIAASTHGIKPTIIPDRLKADSNMVNLGADNAAMAKANAIRQQTVDAQPKGGISTLGDSDAAKWNARMDNERQMQNITDMMVRNPGIAGALSGALTQTAAGQNQQETEQMRQQGIMAGLGVQRRGQDINANSEMNKLAGNPLDQKAKELRNRGIIAGLDHDALIAKAKREMLETTDTGRRSQLQEAILAAQGIDADRGRFARVGGGEEIVDENGAKIRRPDQILDTRTGQIAMHQQAPSAAPKFVVGKTYTDSNGNKSQYQADGTWKDIK